MEGQEDNLLEVSAEMTWSSKF